jgi:biotin carboxyl carrier protein
MHYVAVIDGVECQVEIVESSPDVFRLVIDGRVVDVDAREISPSTLSLIIENKGYNVEYERAQEGSGINMLVRGHIARVDVVDLRTMRLRKAQASAGAMDGPAHIKAPMPGKVVAVLVEEGAHVEAGAGLVVVEAMKMENELKAPRAGTVAKLSAVVGNPVESGALLCVVE